MSVRYPIIRQPAGEGGRTRGVPPRTPLREHTLREHTLRGHAVRRLEVR